MKAVEITNTCKNLILTTFGIQSITRILGIILPDGIGLEMNHSLTPELFEQKKGTICCFNYSSPWPIYIKDIKLEGQK